MGQQIEEVIKHAAHIVALRQELALEEAIVRELLLDHPQNGVTSKFAPPGSLTARIIERMKTDTGKLWSANELVTIAGKSGIRGVRSVLFRLWKRGTLDRPERGRFRLRS